MSGDILVGEVNIGTVNIYAAPDAQVDIPEELARIIRSEMERAGDGQRLGDVYGQDMPEMDLTRDTDTPPTDEEAAELKQAEADELDQERIDLETRSDNLHRLVGKLDQMNNKSGHLASERSPGDDGQQEFERRRSEFRRAARRYLQRACEVCPPELSDDCPLKSNLDAWLDAHAYKDKSGKRRPGSVRIEPPEARRKFIERLRANPKLHCEPTRRPRRPASS